MQKLQDSVFSLVKTTSLSPAVFSFLQPTEESTDNTPLGGILSDTKHGWLALGPKFCVIDLKTGLKIAAKVFGSALSNSKTTVTSVVELPTPLTENSQQLLISLECEGIFGLICVFHINGSQILRCIQTDIIVTNLSISDNVLDGPLMCFDGIVTAGSKTGEIFVFDLNRSALIEALKNISQGYEHLIRSEEDAANITFVPVKAIQHIEEQRHLALENDSHIAVLLNDNSFVDNQYIFRNPDGSIRMKAKRDHIRVSSMQYIPQIGSFVVGFNFGAFQLWNLMNLNLEYTSQVNVECLPVTHFAFQEPCDDPRAFCYLWVVFSVIDSFEEKCFPLAVMYSLTYQGKRMYSDAKFLYQDFSSATLMFEMELSTLEKPSHLIGGRCVSCHPYSIHSTLGDEGEDSMINICQLVWECWGENPNEQPEYGMLLFDLDQWYKAQMPNRYSVCSSPFTSATWCTDLGVASTRALDVRLQPAALAPYSHATRLEEHFYPNSLHYNCIYLNTSEASVLNTVGVQRQIISCMEEVGPTILLHPPVLYRACVAAGLTPLYMDANTRNPSQEYQRRYLLSVALEARLSRFLKRCAHDWATGSHAGVGCTLTFLVDWCWQRAIELKENAKELTAPLFASSLMPDRNTLRCLEHCVQQLTQLTSLLDAVLTKCCNLIVPDVLSEIEEKCKGIGCVSQYFQVVQWFVRVGLLPERAPAPAPYPRDTLTALYHKRRLKLQRLQDSPSVGGSPTNKSCSLLYIDQLIEHEFGGDRIHQMWMSGGSECGLYPPPSLYALLRLYLLPDVADEHKHSLVLYLLVDYSMLYDEIRYEPVIRGLMQFPTMFGLSNTAIKATQAFWHLDHRDFDFALEHLQCLTGSALSAWQHRVVLAALLAQRKTQAALQYLHVRKPRPLLHHHGAAEGLEGGAEWQSCCNLYLARGLVFEALEVARGCVQAARTQDDQIKVLYFFFKGCRSTGQLGRVVETALSPLEEKVLIRYVSDCGDPRTADLLIFYYLHHARYLEAQQLLRSLKRREDRARSTESLAEEAEREAARDSLVQLACDALPAITHTVAHCVNESDFTTHVVGPKPMSVYVQPTSMKNTLTYKTSFIQDTIENASETWINKPKTRLGMKRALNIEETPFICTPKLNRNRKSAYIDESSGETPPKRTKMDPTVSPKKSQQNTSLRVSEKISEELATLLDMPDIQSPPCKLFERSGADTPHSILKTRSRMQSPASPESRYLAESDEELETTSNHTHYSDAAKHLRFTMPTSSESGSTPSPERLLSYSDTKEKETSAVTDEKEMDESYHTTTSNVERDCSLLGSGSDTGEKVKSRSYKDTVRARLLSMSGNSSLSDDPNASIESIADIPITVINPRYSKSRQRLETEDSSDTDAGEGRTIETKAVTVVPSEPRARRGIRDKRNTITPERQDSPIVRTVRITRSRTPESAPLSAIAEQPAHEAESTPHSTTASKLEARQRRFHTPKRSTRSVSESPKLEAIQESPVKSPIIESPKKLLSLRSRSRTPDAEIIPQSELESPRRLRNRAKTPETTKTPVIESSIRGRKSLSRLVLEANTFAKSKGTDIENKDKESDSSVLTSESDSVIECTPMKPSKQPPNFMDVTFSPIVNQSILQSSNDTVVCESDEDLVRPKNEEASSKLIKPAFGFSTVQESYFEKSVLISHESTVTEISNTSREVLQINEPLNTEDKDSMCIKSVLKDVSSLLTSDSDIDLKEEWKSENDKASDIQKEKEKIVEIDREINEIEGDMSNEEDSSGDEEIVQVEEVELQEEQDEEQEEEHEDEQEEEHEDEQEENDEEQDEQEEEQVSETDEEIVSLLSDSTSTDSSDTVQLFEQTSSDSNNEIIASTVLKTTAQIHTDKQDDFFAKQKSNNSENNKVRESESIKGENEGNDTIEVIHSDDKKIEEIHIDPVADQMDLEINKEVPKETTKNVYKTEQEKNTGEVDKWNQTNFSLITDDNSVLSSDRSDLILHCSGPVDKVTEHVDVKNVDKLEETNKDNIVGICVDIVDAFVEKKEPEQFKKQARNESEETKTSEVRESNQSVSHVETESIKRLETCKGNQINVEKTEICPPSKGAPESPKNTKEARKEEKSEIEHTEIELDETPVVMESDKPVRRQRVKSTSSNQSTKRTESVKVSDEPKTPTRKRSVSISKKDEDKKEENVESAKVRKILTRRASKELSEKSDEPNLSVAEVLTPRRRSSRIAKSIDDNASVASDTSVVSNQSRVDDDKSMQARRGRKSVNIAKSELTVIPENAAVNASTSNDEILREMSSSSRMTRKQKATLESWLQPPLTRRRASTASNVSIASNVSVASDASLDSSLEQSQAEEAFNVQPIDRIELLSKSDFEGTPDKDELYNKLISADPLAPDIIDSPSRRKRARSESKCIVKAVKPVNRRTSVDIVGTTAKTVEAELAGEASPLRPRRASFSRACEALHTPKARRSSTDLRRADSESRQISPVSRPSEVSEGEAVVPLRRSRRASSTQSSSSQPRADRPKKAT